MRASLLLFVVLVGLCGKASASLYWLRNNLQWTDMPETVVRGANLTAQFCWLGPPRRMHARYQLSLIVPPPTLHTQQIYQQKRSRSLYVALQGARFLPIEQTVHSRKDATLPTGKSRCWKVRVPIPESTNIGTGYRVALTRRRWLGYRRTYHASPEFRVTETLLDLCVQTILAAGKCAESTLRLVERAAQSDAARAMFSLLARCCSHVSASLTASGEGGAKLRLHANGRDQQVGAMEFACDRQGRLRMDTGASVAPFRTTPVIEEVDTDEEEH